MDPKKTTLMNKNEARHVQINSNLDTGKLKKHYEPLEIQVTFNNEKKNNMIENCMKSKSNGHIEKHNNDNPLLAEMKCPDVNNTSEENLENEMAKLLAMIHLKDTHTIDLLRKHVSFLMTEINKRNTIIFSLLKHLDFAVNQDVENIKNNEQLIEYLNVSTDPVHINDVISSSHWNPDDEKINHQTVNEYDWQLDIFQYIKDNIDSIDTILELPENTKDGSSVGYLHNMKKMKNILDKNNEKNSKPGICNGIPTDNKTTDSAVTPNKEITENGTEEADDDEDWEPNTVAVIGDNMLNGLDEKRLGGKNWNVRCRHFPDSQVNDFFEHIKPILKKKPTHLVCHVGTNDAPYFSSIDIYNSIISLKQYVEEELPTCKVIISRPIIRMDDCKANMVILKINQYLDNLKIPTVDNGNFGLNHLSNNGPELNPKGTARLAMNIISHLRSLQNELPTKAAMAAALASPSGTNTPPPATNTPTTAPTTPVAPTTPTPKNTLNTSGPTTPMTAEALFRASRLNPSAKSFNPITGKFD